MTNSVDSSGLRRPVCPRLLWRRFSSFFCSAVQCSDKVRVCQLLFLCPWAMSRRQSGREWISMQNYAAAPLRTHTLSLKFLRYGILTYLEIRHELSKLSFGEHHKHTLSNVQSMPPIVVLHVAVVLLKAKNPWAQHLSRKNHDYSCVCEATPKFKKAVPRHDRKYNCGQLKWKGNYCDCTKRERT